MSRQRQQPSEDERTKRRLEAIAATAGAILALGTIGIVGWNGVTGDDTPPIVIVEPLGVHEHEDGYVLEVLVFNRGDETAAAVTVEGALRRDGTVVATAEATFDYVARGSRRRGGLYFAEDPRRYDVKVRALGYIEP
ncbi:MAG TPA: TIGR02588 family protein [Propylenella sp.]|jgi:uncharacterized protein (TIGR02588 family)